MSVIVYPALIDRDVVRPSVDDVAMLTRTRTIDSGDKELTTFTDDTRPTNYEVEVLIDGVMDEVLSRIPDMVLPGFDGQIRRLIALGTAVAVEGSFYREQTAAGPVALWQRQYDNGLKDLQGLLRTGIVL